MHLPLICIHIHSLGLIFTRLIMPQVKYLRRCFWFVGNCFYSQLSPWGYIVHLNCFAGMTKRSHEFVIKEEIKFVNIPKVWEQAPLFSSNFAHGQRCTRKKKLIFRSSMKFPFQRIQDQWIWRPVQGDMARILDVARSEIRQDRLQHWDKMDTTLLFGINFGRIRTRWKGKFVHFAMEQCFSTCSVLEIERKNSWRWGSNGTTRN